MPAMTEFGPAVWPPSTPIRTERLVLREAEARDHAVFIDLLGHAAQWKSRPPGAPPATGRTLTDTALARDQP